MKKIEQQIDDWNKLNTLVREYHYSIYDSTEKKEMVREIEIEMKNYFEKYQVPFNPVRSPK